MNDYPAMIAVVNHVEPVPRRIRGVLAGETVVDTIKALYVWEWSNYPQYFIPVEDVRKDVLIDEHRTHQTRVGGVQMHGVEVGEVRRDGAARLVTDSPVEGLNGTVRFRLGRARQLVRGGRAGLRPPAESLRACRRASLDAARANRAGRGRARRVRLAGHGVRDRTAHPLLRRPAPR